MKNLKAYVFVTSLCLALFSGGQVFTKSADWYTKGERLHYNVKFWMIKAGEAEIYYQPNGEEYTVVARSWGGDSPNSFVFIRDRLLIRGEHTEDSEFLTKTYEVRLNENDYRANKLVTYYRNQSQTGYKNHREPQSPMRLFSVQEDTRDILSALYHLRREVKEELQAGEVYKASVFDLNTPYILELNILEKEKMHTIFGENTAVVHIQPYLRSEKEGEKDSNRWHLWVTDDDRRIPVKIQAKLNFGSFTAILHSHGDAGSASLAPKELPERGEFHFEEDRISNEYKQEMHEQFVNPIPD